MLVALVGPFVPHWVAIQLQSPACVAEGVQRASGTPAVASVSIDWLSLVTGLWLLGVLVLLGRVVLGARLVRSLRRGNTPKWLKAEGMELAETMRLRVPVRFVLGRAPVPLVTGALRPVISLPQEFGSWPAEQRRAVLMHELAHVNRFDCVWTAFANVLAAVYWCHPLVWLLRRALRDEAELAADERVVAAGVPATDYAGHLVATARLCRKPRGLVRSLGVTIMSHRTLEHRVKRILGTRAQGMVTASGLLLALGITSATIAVAGASARMQQAPTAPMSPAPQVAPTPATSAPPAPVLAPAPAVDTKPDVARIRDGRARKRSRSAAPSVPALPPAARLAPPHDRPGNMIPPVEETPAPQQAAPAAAPQLAPGRLLPPNESVVDARAPEAPVAVRGVAPAVPAVTMSVPRSRQRVQGTTPSVATRSHPVSGIRARTAKSRPGGLGGTRVDPLTPVTLDQRTVMVDPVGKQTQRIRLGQLGGTVRVVCVPFLSDIPIIGRLFRTRVEERTPPPNKSPMPEQIAPTDRP